MFFIVFFERQEREDCSGLRLSNLYRLSNPGYLGEAGGRTDSAVIAWLEAVFEQNINTAVAEEKLREVVVEKKRASFTYASTVLFPETFIHQLEAMGTSRTEAEVIFLQQGEVEEDERRALKREMKEAAKRQEEEEKHYEEEEWVDHSDLDE